MDVLRKQVEAARRRLFWQQFVAWLPGCLSVALLIAAAAIAAPKIWSLPVKPQVWPWAWLASAVVVGMIGAWIAAVMNWPSTLQAAVELDHRFGLKERVSSSLALTDAEQTTDIGKALLNDALRRVTKVNVKERFRLTVSRWLALPCGLAVAAFALTLLSDAQPDPLAKAQAATVSVKQRVQNSAAALKKKLEERKKQAIEQGIPEATEMFDKLEKGVDSLKQQSDVDRQKTLVKLNDLARDVQNRQKELLNRDELQKQLGALKDIKQGPADRMAQAMKQGDFKAALDALKDLQNKMDKGELSKEDQEKLQAQLNEMKDKLQSMARAQEEAKRELQKQIEQKLAQGDRESAGKLQNKLDQLSKKDAQAQKMDKLAEKLASAANAMQQGNAQEASAQMNDLANEMQGMQDEIAEAQLLEETLDQIASAKDSLVCDHCNGMGCDKCQGDMNLMGGKGKGEGQGKGMGEGRGQGDRPESETATNFYESQVRTKPGAGKAVTTGSAPGPNRSGQALEEVKLEIEAGRQASDDPLTGQRLPKPQRELTREYFDAFREGK